MPKKLGERGNAAGDGSPTAAAVKTADPIPAARDDPELVRSMEPPVIKQHSPAEIPQLIYSDMCPTCEDLFDYINGIDFELEMEYVNIDDLIRQNLRAGKKPLPKLYQNIEYTPTLLVFEGQSVRIFDREEVREYIEQYVEDNSKPLQYDPSKKNVGDPTTFSEDWKTDKNDDISLLIDKEATKRGVGKKK